jgi:hypothetical protein
MRHGSLICIVLALAGCPGGDGAIGDHCSSHSDCSSQLQCVNSTCVPRCERAPDCGDGFRCTEDGICQAATGKTGDRCTSEVDCSAGLSCQIEGTEIADDGNLLASCVEENAGHPAGATCEHNGDCRDGTCDLGHCIDLCSTDRDCGTGTLCTTIPRLIGVEELQAVYRGCLQSRGSVRWPLVMHSPSEDLFLPVPSSARSVSVLFSVDDPSQKVGVTHLYGIGPPGEAPTLLAPTMDYYTNPFVRHRPDYGESVLAMPMSPAPTAQLVTVVYRMHVSALKQAAPSPTCTPEMNQNAPFCTIGSATPTVTAVIKVDDAAILDLHFYFLNLDDHPCADKLGGKLDATTAQTSAGFSQYLAEIKNVLGSAVYFEVGNVTYEDLRDHPDLDGLDLDNTASLLSLGTHASGINVFFVRTLSPVGLQAIGPNPGPAGLGGTRRSGIVIGVDSLCYRRWSDLARLTSREIARYMGLYDNVEIDYDSLKQPTHVDPIGDSDTERTNLMFYSELGGTFLSDGQKSILRRSAVLR